MDKFWMIVDVVGAETHPKGERLQSNRAPRCMYEDESQAETDLLELQKKYPGGTFVLLESVGHAPHNLGGLLHIERY